MKRYNLGLIDQALVASNLMLPIFWFSLDEKIDKERLEKAVTKAQEYHPNFKTKLVKDKGLYYFVENSLPFKVFEGDWKTDLHISSEDNNYYPWCLVISGKDIFYTGSHALSDGGGSFQMMQTVLRFYYELEGEVFEGDFGIPEAEIIEKSAHDPYIFENAGNVKNPLPKNKNARKKKALKIPKHSFDMNPGNKCVKQLVLDADEIRRMGKDTQTSTFAVISVILARSLVKVTGRNKGFVDVGVAVNYRSITGKSTDRSFAKTFQLKYDIAKEESMPLSLTALAFRSQLDIETDHDKIMYDFSVFNRIFDILKHFPIFLTLIKLVFHNRLLETDRARIIYTHIVRHGYDEQLLKHIVTMRLLSRSGLIKKMNSVMAITFKGKIYLNICSPIKNNLWPEKIEEVLKEMDIKYEMQDGVIAPNIMCDVYQNK